MLKAPFPYFGGKRRIAPRVWELLGDVGGYVEPFAGSLAVLLARPHTEYRRRVETVNEFDGNITNLWRAIKYAPEETASYCDAPVSEIELFSYRLETAYHERTLARKLAEDTEYYDAKLAGHTLYALSGSIGSPWGGGPWRLMDTPSGLQLTNKPAGGGLKAGQVMLNANRGIHAASVSAQVPALADAGKDVNTLRDSRTRREQITHRLQPLTDRLQTVRILSGDWQRAVTPAVLNVTQGNPNVGVFLDPPYDTGAKVYTHDENQTVSHRVREWCKTINPEHRVILCGYGSEHDELLAYGWRKETGLAGGSGYSKTRDSETQERLWLSPAIPAHMEQPLF